MTIFPAKFTPVLSSARDDKLIRLHREANVLWGFKLRFQMLFQSRLKFIILCILTLQHESFQEKPNSR